MLKFCIHDVKCGLVDQEKCSYAYIPPGTGVNLRIDYCDARPLCSALLKVGYLF